MFNVKIHLIATVSENVQSDDGSNYTLWVIFGPFAASDAWAKKMKVQDNTNSSDMSNL